MRGRRTQIARKKVDLVLVSARYEPGSGRLVFARGYERQGQVWSDIRLFQRTELLELMEAGRAVVTGQTEALVGDFEVFGPVQIGADGQLFADGDPSTGGDDLGLPIL